MKHYKQEQSGWRFLQSIEMRRAISGFVISGLSGDSYKEVDETFPF